MGFLQEIAELARKTDLLYLSFNSKIIVDLVTHVDADHPLMRAILGSRPAKTRCHCGASFPGSVAVEAEEMV